MSSPFESKIEETNRCLFCNRRNKSGYCLPLKTLVKGQLERFNCDYFVPKKENPPNNPGKKGGCSGCG